MVSDECSLWIVVFSKDYSSTDQTKFAGCWIRSPSTTRREAASCSVSTVKGCMMVVNHLYSKSNLSFSTSLSHQPTSGACTSGATLSTLTETSRFGHFSQQFSQQVVSFSKKKVQETLSRVSYPQESAYILWKGSSKVTEPQQSAGFPTVQLWREYVNSILTIRWRYNLSHDVTAWLNPH